jgi:GAF domain-containing protein
VTSASPQDDWRATAVDELHGMLATTVPVAALLDAVVARSASRAGPGGAAAITLRRNGAGTVAAASDERSAACDRAEQDAGDGPCLESARVGHVITIPDVTQDARWPLWRAATLHAGFGSAAALPAPPRETGPDIELAINLYRPDAGPWDEDLLADVVRFAEDAARAVVVAAHAEQQARVNTDLKQAMASRSVIDQAMGVVMAQNRCGPEEAFGILRRASQHRNAKLRDIATQIVQRVSGQEPGSAREFRDRSVG